MAFGEKFLAFSFVCASTTMAVAQDKYDTYIGQYAASVHISLTCKGMTTYNRKDAGTIAKRSEGLRKQKVIRTLTYGKRDQLVQLGNAALKTRGVDPKNDKQLCRFAREIAGKDDKIGRFLRAN